MFLWRLHKTARDATCSISRRDLSTDVGTARRHDQLLFDRRRDRRHDAVRSTGLLCLVREMADGRGHPEDVSVTRKGRVAAGEVGDPAQSVAHRIWMNEQLA